MSAAKRKHIATFVVVPPCVLLLDIAGPIEALRKANLEQATIVFDIVYIGPSPKVGSSIGLDVSGIAPLPPSLPNDALIIIAGAVDQPLGGRLRDRATDSRHEARIVTWLKGAVRPGMRLVTICSGALLAARAGLLDGRECTTHHATISELKQLASTAQVHENRLYVVDGERLTSAGITAGIDLMLHVVAQETGHATALAVARYLLVYMRRGGADPQLSPWLEGRNHIHPAIHRAQDAIAANPGGQWSVVRLAKVAVTSPRNLSRLFSTHAGMSVTDYVNRIKIALARELVTGSRLDMEKIAERAGFASARQFRRVWSRWYDTPPARVAARAIAHGKR